MDRRQNNRFHAWLVCGSQLVLSSVVYSQHNRCAQLPACPANSEVLHVHVQLFVLNVPVDIHDRYRAKPKQVDLVFAQDKSINQCWNATNELLHTNRSLRRQPSWTTRIRQRISQRLHSFKWIIQLFRLHLRPFTQPTQIAIRQAKQNTQHSNVHFYRLFNSDIHRRVHQTVYPESIWNQSFGLRARWINLHGYQHHIFDNWSHDA